MVLDDWGNSKKRCTNGGKKACQYYPFPHSEKDELQLTVYRVLSRNQRTKSDPGVRTGNPQ